MADTPLKRLLDAGVQFSDMSRQQAESLVRNLVKEGEVRRKDAEDLVQSLIERGKETSEHIAATVQKEMSKQMAALTSQFEELERRIEALSQQLRGTTPASAKKATAKKAPAKKAPAKKATAKKATAKKATAKKSTAKKATGSSGVRKVSTSRPA